MTIELRFYKQRYNTDEEYYRGNKGIYLTLYYPDEETLIADWNNLFERKVAGHWLEGETYSAWDEDGSLLCGGAFDMADIDYIVEKNKEWRHENKMENIYGIPEMTIEEEINLPALAKTTLGNKIKIVDWCDNMEQAIKSIRRRAQEIPIKNDAEHSNLVNRWTMMVMAVNRSLDDCVMYGRSK